MNRPQPRFQELRSLILLIFILGNTLQSFSQNNDCSGYNQRFQDVTIRFDVGAFIPVDNLKNTVGICPNLGLYVSVQLKKKFSIALGTSIFIPIKSHKLDFFLPDTTLTGKARLSGTMGFWLSRTEKLKKCWLLENRFGTGLGFFQTNIPTNKPKEENDSVQSSETIFICLGTGISKIVHNSSVGLSINYYVVPYNAFTQHLKTDFGCQYATLTTCLSF